MEYMSASGDAKNYKASQPNGLSIILYNISTPTIAT